MLPVVVVRFVSDNGIQCPIISIFLWNTCWHHSCSRGETKYRHAFWILMTGFDDRILMTGYSDFSYVFERSQSPHIVSKNRSFDYLWSKCHCQDTDLSRVLCLNPTSICQHHLYDQLIATTTPKDDVTTTTSTWRSCLIMHPGSMWNVTYP